MSSSDDEKKATKGTQSGDAPHNTSAKTGKALERTPTANDVDALPKDALDPVYAAKAEVLNRAIQEIGFGRYQVSLVSF